MKRLRSWYNIYTIRSLLLNIFFFLFIFLFCSSTYPNLFSSFGPYMPYLPNALVDSWINIEKYVHINVSSPNHRSNMSYFFTEDIDIYYNNSLNNVTLQPYPDSPRYRYTYNTMDCYFSIYKNCYVTGCGVLSNGTHFISPPHDNGPELIRPLLEGPIVEHLEYACVFGHWYMSFGHFICDYLFPLLAAPKDFVEKSLLIICKPIHVNVYEYICALNLQHKAVILRKNEWAFVEHLMIATNPRPHLLHFGPSPQILADKLRKLFNVDQIEPTRYVLVNRKSGRSFGNYDQIFKAIKKNFPAYNWEKLFDSDMNISEIAILYSSFKFMGTMAGSNVYKAIFMKSHTSVVIFGTSAYDHAVYLFLSARDIKNTIFVNPDFNHHPPWKTYYHISLEKVIPAFKVAIYMHENGRWPEIINNSAFIN